MTKKEFRKKFNEEVRENNKLIRRLREQALSCGAFDITSYENNYRLPKIVITAILTECARQWKPFDDSAKKEVKNLEHFLC